MPVVSLQPLHAVVPVRGLTTGKARLAGAIDAEEREELVVGLLRRTLKVLHAWKPLAATHVVSADPAVLEIAVRGGARRVADPSVGLNNAIQAGIRAARQAGANAVLVLPGDLPLLDGKSLDHMLEAADAALAAGSGGPIVVIAPADARNGTNGLLLAPVDVIEPSFGSNSFEAHARAAKSAEATVQVFTDPGLGYDLDTTDDLERLRADRLRELLELGRPSIANTRG